MDISSDNNLDKQTSSRKYSREELFSLAKSMKNSEKMTEELVRFENADWTKNQLDLPDKDASNNEAKYVSLYSFSKSISNLGYETNHDHSSPNDPQEGDWRKGFPSSRARISRMTSSPSIRLRSNTNRNQIIDSLPIQVRSKYARLIESFSKSLNNKSQQPDNLVQRNQPQPFKDTGLTNGQNKTNERPNKLARTLKRETSKYKERRSSEEPLSLPYIDLNYDRTSHNITRTNVKPLHDDTSSPVQRYSSSNTPSLNNLESGNVEEDEFDITSLLSITVLSDIKTIRQECQPANNRRPLIFNRLSTKNRTDNKEPLTRSRTSTDFTYNGRRLGHDTDERVDHSFHRGYEQLCGTESLSYSYWPHEQNLFENREMAQERQQTVVQEEAKYNNQVTKKPVDESAAHIIETFKAQVKARAERQTITESVKEPEVKKVGMPYELNVKCMDKSDDSNSLSSLKTTKHSDRETAVVAPQNKTREFSQSQEVQVPDKSVPQPVESSNEGRQASLSKISNSSQIPRLIRLHGTKFSSSLDLEKKLEVDEQKASSKPKKTALQCKRLIENNQADDTEDRQK